MPSVLFGLVTVLCTYAIALRCGLTRRLALAATATVALWPKFVLVSATVQNDALGIALGSVLILLVLAWLRAPAAQQGWSWRRVALPVGIGIAMGAAALTKYTVLPLAGLLGVVMLVAALRSPRARRLPEVAVAGVVAAACCAWWLLRNIDRYGDPLASAATAEYLAGAMPGLAVPTSFTDGLRFGEFVPRVLLESFWYTGGWNQFVLPLVVNLGLTMAAAAAAVGALRVGLRGGLVGGPRLSGWASTVLWTSVAGAFVGLLLIARETTQAQGRYLFVAIAAIAVLLTVGTAELTDVRPRLQRWCIWLWPALMALTGLYAAVRFLLPFAGL
jgi:4-amino-4-deoxy-L-arabinose transferase-like glycosyltransferase